MFTKTKIALAAALVLATAFSASAATNSSNVMPGYDKTGAVVAIPNSDQAQR